MTWTNGLTLSGIVLGLAGALVAALISRRHDRQQLSRNILLKSADDFARSALAVLAALRHVTPPTFDPASDFLHRNEGLLSDATELQDRLTAARVALDNLRVVRASVRLSFHPKSWPAEHSRMVLVYLRQASEYADQYYASFDRKFSTVEPLGDEAAKWRVDGRGFDLRDLYMKSRGMAYQNLEWFFDSVADRLKSPTWNPWRIEAAKLPPGRLEQS